MRVKCLAQEHNTMSPARARTWTARSGHERTNHEATAPPTGLEITPLYWLSEICATPKGMVLNCLYFKKVLDFDYIGVKLGVFFNMT